MSTPVTQGQTRLPSKRLNASLWAIQGLLALTFAGTGVWKLLTPIAELSQMIPWTGQVSPAMVATIAVVDLLGGIGVLLPSLTRIKPGLSVLAAIGCAVLMLAAVVFHALRGEGANTPFNFVLLGFSLFVAWGRRSKAPITARA